MTAIRRLIKDMERLNESNLQGIRASLKNDDNLFEWIAEIEGPSDTVFNGGTFILQLLFPKNYPMKPPKVKFISNNIYHPNVYPNGNLCLDILQNKWSPLCNPEKILLSIISLLSDPNPDSPANIDAAKDFRTNKELYRANVLKKLNL